MTHVCAERPPPARTSCRYARARRVVRRLANVNRITGHRRILSFRPTCKSGDSDTFVTSSVVPPRLIKVFVRLPDPGIFIAQEGRDHVLEDVVPTDAAVAVTDRTDDAE